MRTLEDIVDQAFGRPRLLSALLGTFAGIALGLTVVGIAIGLAAALALGRFLADRLGVTSSDPTTLVAVAMTVVAIVGVACWLPLHRAGQVDPIVVLRQE
jgi:ABC-type antimicrobial peptide transport system permease subunit